MFNILNNIFFFKKKKKKEAKGFIGFGLTVLLLTFSPSP
jgi:hypothetical protein